MHQCIRPYCSTRGLITSSVPIHYLNQCWLIGIFRTKFNEMLIKVQTFYWRKCVWNSCLQSWPIHISQVNFSLQTYFNAALTLAYTTLLVTSLCSSSPHSIFIASIRTAYSRLPLQLPLMMEINKITYIATAWGESQIKKHYNDGFVVWKTAEVEWEIIDAE